MELFQMIVFMKKVAIIGAGISGLFFANLLRQDSNYEITIYEKNNSKKIGYFAPSTKIPILSDSNLLKINKKVPIINLAWHIDLEIKKYLRKKKINNKIITIVNKKDFK